MDTEPEAIWVAYHTDYSAIAVFYSEIKALRYAVEHSMEVNKITEGSIQEQIQQQWAARQSKS